MAGVPFNIEVAHTHRGRIRSHLNVILHPSLPTSTNIFIIESGCHFVVIVLHLVWPGLGPGPGEMAGRGEMNRVVKRIRFPPPSTSTAPGVASSVRLI